MGNFQLPKTTVLDTSGNPIVGAKLYFYITGTSTPENVYQDEAQATAHTNPVVADAAGRVADIYLNTAVTYKIVVKDAADATIYTVDPIKGYSLVGADISTRVMQLGSNPLDYGAIGDGVANEAAAVQSAVTNATGTVDLLGKTYRCDTTITLISGKRLINGTLDFSNCTQAKCVDISGSQSGASALTANATVGDTTLTFGSTSGWAAGDFLQLYSTVDWYTSVDDGELVRIKSVDSGTQVTLYEKLCASYTTANAGSVRRLTPVQNVSLEDLRIIGAQSVTQSGVYVSYADNIRVRDVTVYGVYSYGFDVRASNNVRLSRTRAAKVTEAATGYGVYISQACRDIDVEGHTTDNAVFGAVVGGATWGVSRKVRFRGCAFLGVTGAGALLDSASQYAVVDGCEVSFGAGATADGIRNFGIDNIVRGNTIRHAGRYGVWGIVKRALAYTTAGGGSPASKTDADSWRCEGNTIEMPASHGVYYQTDAASSLVGASIAGNRVNGAGGSGIYVDCTAKGGSDIRIDGNDIKDSTAIPIFLTVAGSMLLPRYSISKNIAVGHSAVNGIEIYGGDDFALSDGLVSQNIINGGALGIKATRSRGTNYSGNHIKSTSDYGLSLIDASLCVVTGNIFSATAGGVKYTNSSAQSDVDISDNSFYATTGKAVFADINESFYRLDISRNRGRGTTSSRIDIDVAAAMTLLDLSIVGNRWGTSGNNLTVILLTVPATAAIDRFSILSNHLQSDNTAGSNSAIRFTGAGTISKGAVVGNVFIGGNYGIDSAITTVTTCAAGGNYGVALGAATINVTGGAWTYAAVSAVAADLPSLS